MSCPSAGPTCPGTTRRGLVDVNSAPAQAIATWLGLSEAQAAHVVDVRQTLGKFQHPYDLVHLAGLKPHLYDAIRNRVVLL